MRTCNADLVWPAAFPTLPPRWPCTRVPHRQRYQPRQPLQNRCNAMDGDFKNRMGWTSLYEGSAWAQEWKDGSGASLHDIVNSLLEKQASGHLLPSDVALAWYHVVESNLLVDKAENGSSVKVLLGMANAHHRAMDPKSISALVWALTKAELGAASIFPSLYGNQAAESLINFEPGEVTILLWAAAAHPQLEDSYRMQPFQQLVILVESGLDLSLFSFYELSVLTWATGRVGYHHPALIDAVQKVAVEKVNTMVPADASRLMYGFSLLNTNPVRLLSPLTQQCEKCIGDFTATDLTLFVTSLGRLSVEPETSFLKAIDRRIGEFISIPSPKLRKLKSKTPGISIELEKGHCSSASPVSTPDGISPNHIASLAWSFARMGHKPLQGGFLIKSLKHLEVYTDIYAIREVSAILWACSSLGVAVRPATLVAVARYLDALLVKTNHDPPISILVKTVNYLATVLAQSKKDSSTSELSIIHNSVLKVTKAYVKSINAGRIVPAELAHMLIALGTLNIKPTHVSGFVSCWRDLQQGCVMVAEDLSVYAFPRVAWALVRLKWGKCPAFDAIANAAVSRCALFSPEGIVQMTWACASVKRPFLKLIPTLVTHGLAKLRYLDAKRKVRLAWSYARLLSTRTGGQPDQAALQRVIDSLSKDDIGHLEPPSISALLWACGKLEGSRGDRAVGLIANHMTKRTSRFSEEQLRQAKVLLAQCNNQS